MEPSAIKQSAPGAKGAPTCTTCTKHALQAKSPGMPEPSCPSPCPTKVTGGGRGSPWVGRMGAGRVKTEHGGGGRCHRQPRVETPERHGYNQETRAERQDHGQACEGHPSFLPFLLNPRAPMKEPDLLRSNCFEICTMAQRK